jgi:hypothetical protein
MADLQCMDKYWHYENCEDSKATKPCPDCNKNMVVLWDEGIMLSNPPQRRWYWWCGCGRREVAGVHVFLPSSKE